MGIHDLVLLIMVVGIVAGLGWTIARHNAPAAAFASDGSQPLFAAESAGEHRGRRFVAVRERLVTEGRYLNTSIETIAMQSSPSACRFVLDRDIYRGQSDLYSPVRVRGALGLEVGPPFWRSDERERLEWLKKDERFIKALSRFDDAPDFGAIAVVASDEARIPLGSPARRLKHDGDLLILSRRGERVPYRDIDFLVRDLDALADLAALLTSNIVPAELPRASAHSAGLAILIRVLRSVVLFFAVLGVFALIGWAAWHC